MSSVATADTDDDNDTNGSDVTMAMDEQQTLLGGGGGAANRSQLSVTIVEMSAGSPQPSPLSDHSSNQILESTMTGDTPLLSSHQGGFPTLSVNNCNYIVSLLCFEFV